MNVLSDPVVGIHPACCQFARNFKSGLGARIIEESFPPISEDELEVQLPAYVSGVGIGKQQLNLHHCLLWQGVSSKLDLPIADPRLQLIPGVITLSLINKELEEVEATLRE